MVQVLEKVEKDAIYILVPDIQEKAEKIEEKIEKKKPKLMVRRHAKQHQERVNINKVSNKVDACRYGINIYNR